MLEYLKNAEDFDKTVQRKDKKILVDFFATWCGPCNMLSPVLEEFSKENPEIDVLKVDVDEFGDIAGKYNVLTIPTLIAFNNGESYNRNSGFMDKEKLSEFVKG